MREIIVDASIGTLAACAIAWIACGIECGVIHFNHWNETKQTGIEVSFRDWIELPLNRFAADYYAMMAISLLNAFITIGAIFVFIIATLWQ